MEDILQVPRPHVQLFKITTKPAGAVRFGRPADWPGLPQPLRNWKAQVPLCEKYIMACQLSELGSYAKQLRRRNLLLEMYDHPTTENFRSSSEFICGHPGRSLVNHALSL
jgi:hypothetical protein